MPYLLHMYPNCYADKTISKEKCLNSKVFLGKLKKKRKQMHVSLLSRGGLGDSAASTTEWNKTC